ncbi:hypothetical protein Tsp_09692 [Trichinella spiralis]|uniref:hypothetical protein n=1 Tax=Trichinella spiralis TaxID=6334 RepID=UPI0001EFD338|nr:hypothetical protein Tsp_09692 [Trichinella spiralis]
MTLGVPPVELAAGDEAIIADTDESGKGPSACQAQFWKKETKPPKVEINGALSLLELNYLLKMHNLVQYFSILANTILLQYNLHL